MFNQMVYAWPPTIYSVLHIVFHTESLGILVEWYLSQERPPVTKPEINEVVSLDRAVQAYKFINLCDC